MHIETVADLANAIADQIGIYGPCKHSEENGCKYSETKTACCRPGFTIELEERIRQAVENDKKLENLNIST